MKVRHSSIVVLALSAVASGAQIVVAQAAEPLRFEGAVVTLVEQTEIPARVAGVLSVVAAKEGGVTRAGEVLAQIDDTDARLAVDHARLQWNIAVAESKNTFRIEAALKAAEAARAELQRAVESVEKYKKSISDSELDRLRFMAEKTQLEHAQARHEHEVARAAAQVKENELQVAARKAELHAIAAPADGMVVEVKRRVGEWVEPGMSVARIVRIDSLRVETLIDADDVPRSFVGTPVRLTVNGVEPQLSVRGRITFVSPEANPVNGQVRIWAEVENDGGRLRPGMQGTLEVMSSASESKSPQPPAKGSR